MFNFRISVALQAAHPDLLWSSSVSSLNARFVHMHSLFSSQSGAQSIHEEYVGPERRLG